MKRGSMKWLSVALIAVLLSLACAVAPATASTVAWWRFEEGAANTAASGSETIIDSSAHLNHGTPFGGPVYRTVSIPGCDPANARALQFDGSDDQVIIPDHSAYEITSSVTLEAVIRYDGQAAGQVPGPRILVRGDNVPGFPPYALGVTPDGQVYFAVASSTSVASQVSSPMRIPTNVFLHIAGSLDGATGQQKLFVNGLLVMTASTTVRPRGVPGLGPGIGIGNIPFAFSQERFKGIIDEVRISDTALSPDQFLYSVTRLRPMVFFPDYYPTDPNVYGKRVYMNWDASRPLDTNRLHTREITGAKIVPYASGAITGVVERSNYPNGDEYGNLFDESYIFNDRSVVKYLGGTDEGHVHFVSTDASLTAHPQTESYRELYDGALMIKNCWLVREDRNDFEETYDVSLIDIQNVTVNGVVYSNAVVFWDELDLRRPFVPPSLLGASAWLNFSLPTASDTLGYAVENFVIFGLDTGIIAEGDFDDVGNLAEVDLFVGSPVLSVTPTSRLIGPDGAQISCAVTNSGTGPMNWAATVTAGGNWMRITSGATGNVSGAVMVQCDTNLDYVTRTGTVQIVAAHASGSPATVTVIQSPYVPHLSVAPASQLGVADGGQVSFAVTNSGNGPMSWSANVVAGSGWMSILSGAAGDGSGSIAVTYDLNLDGVTRTGAVSVAGAVPVASVQVNGSPATVTVVQPPLVDEVGDDFKDNEKDDAKWGDDRSSTPGQGLNALTEIRRRMEYTASGHIASLRPWVAGVGSYTQDWAVAADVHLGNIALTENESHVQMGLFVCDNSDATNWYGLGVSGDYAYMMLDIYRGTNGVQERSLDGDCHVNAGGDEDLDLPHPPDDTASELVGVRIAFEAATKTLTIWYDADGIANGYTWIPYQSLRLGSTNWDMDATSTFSIGVLANSERHTVTSGDQVYVDNFRFRGSVPRAHVFFPDYLPADPVVYGKKVYEHTQYTNATDSISSLFTTELGGPVTVPYTSGAITGVVEKGSVLGAGSYFFNDGNVVKVLGQYDDDDSGQTHMYLTSSDANLTACPESQTFREVYDGALKPDCWWIREGRGGAPQAPVGDFSLIDIQDVTVGTNVYPNAVVGWEINVSRSFKSLNLHGLDAKLGIAFPTAAQALGCFVDGFIVFGRDNGVIANGWFDTNGILESLAVLQSVSRWPGVAITGPTNAPNYTSGTSLLTVSGTARDYDGVVSVSIRNNRDVAGFACSGTTNWFYTDLPVYQGKNTIEVIVTNATGNASTGTVVVTYTGDTNYQDVLRSGALVQKIEFPDNLTTGETVTVQWDVLSYVPIRSRVDAGVNGTESNKWSFFKYGQYKGSVASPWNLYGRKANVYSFECSWPVPQKPGDFSVWFNVAQMDGDQYMIPVIPEGVGSRIDPVRSKLITRTIMSVTTNDLVGPDPQSDDTNDHWAVDQAIETVEEHQRRSGATVTYVNMPTNLVQGTVTNCEWKILSYVDVNAQFLWINLTNKQVWATCNGRPVSSVGTTYNFVDRKDGTQRYANEYTFNADFMVPTNATPGDQQVFFRCQEAAFPTSSWMSANLSADIDPRQVRMNGMYGRFIERTLQVNVSTNAP